jgi:hypothetical protein
LNFVEIFGIVVMVGGMVVVSLVVVCLTSMLSLIILKLSN